VPLNLSILYRGLLSSCNYACSYCPFAKHWESSEELLADQIGLQRFIAWVASHSADQFAILLTPWGEALVRSWYRDAIVQLSHLPHVSKVAVQTNLSCQLDWLKSARIEKLGLWCTYHPGQVDRRLFVNKCHSLSELGVKHSVGCVGLREHVSEIQALRAEIAPGTYVWINAFKSVPDYYDQLLLDAFTGIDALFPINNTDHPSCGHVCRTGHTVLSVDSYGDVRRCHFVKQVIANIYDPNFEDALKPRLCPNETCGCHIGYVHLEHLEMDQIFGNGILERIPAATALQKQHR
jgi:MoaA/NifB/PqqE/SkfB family radical SAM enzyme